MGSGTLASAGFKVDRAKEHLSSLKEAVKAFLDTAPYKIGTKREPHSRKLIYYMASLEPVPWRVSALAGDVLNNLRSALDHLAFQLFFAGTGKPGDSFKHVYFPIADDAAKFKAKSPRQVRGMGTVAMNAIGALEPYKGGKGHQFWLLHNLNNVDKHRLLIAAGSAFRSVNLGAHAMALHREFLSQLPDEMDPWVKEGGLPTLDAFFRPADRLCPLKVGDELLIDAPDAKPNEEIGFRFEIAISEPGIVDGEPIVETLRVFTQLVEGTLSSFIALV